MGKPSYYNSYNHLNSFTEEGYPGPELLYKL